MIDYLKFVELIKEGLIRTHNIEKYYESLDIELNAIGIKSEIEIKSKFLFHLTILNSNDVANEKLEYVITICKDLLGYYPSYIWVKNNISWNGFKFDQKYLDNKYTNIKIRFESKYEDGLYKNTLEVPKIAYHLSPTKNRKRINDMGIYAKSGSRKTYHNDRVYLFYDLNDYEKLLNSLKISDKTNQSYDLYEITLDDKNVIHTDPNYIKGFYTYDSIRPSYIKMIKSDL